MAHYTASNTEYDDYRSNKMTTQWLTAASQNCRTITIKLHE